MSEPTLIALVFGSFSLLLILRVPVAFCLGLSAFGYCFAAGLPPLVVAQKMSVQLADTTLMAIPFFILCGEIMSAGSMAGRLIDLANVCVGFVRGGLAMVNIVASMFFGGISGSSVADTSSLGSVLIPMMTRKGYDRDFSVAVTVTSSTQGIIIPPSHNAILFSLAAGGTVSVQALFLAGYVPGLLIGLVLMGLSALIARRRGYPAERMVPWREATGIVARSIPAVVTPLIIIVPIAMGKIPPHQAAVIAVLWAAVVSTLDRSLPLGRYADLLGRTARTSGMVLLLIATAAAFGEVMTYLHVPSRLTTALASLGASEVVTLLLLNVMLLVLGAVMDMAPLIVIVTPILLPVATSLGMDPVHFGIVLLINLGIGLCTPPVGSTLFVGCAVGEITMEEAVRGLWPFYLAMVVVLLLVTFVPELSLFLPRWVAGG